MNHNKNIPQDDKTGEKIANTALKVRLEKKIQQNLILWRIAIGSRSGSCQFGHYHRDPGEAFLLLDRRILPIS
jgi:hypothetical protein